MRLKAKNHTIYLHCCTSFCRCILTFSSSALHLAPPLPHNHLASSRNTYIPNRRKQHKSFNAIKHCPSGFDEPCLHAVESKNSQSPTEKKTCFLQKPLNHFLFTLKTLNLKICYTTTFGFMLALSILSSISLLFYTFFSQTSSTGGQSSQLVAVVNQHLFWSFNFLIEVS